MTRNNLFFSLNRKSSTLRHIGIGIASVIMLTLGQACSSTKKVTTVTEPVKPENQEKKPEDYLAQTIAWSSFSGKADMHFENKDQNQDFTGNLRMHKGKDIWASVIALGIAEVARASITPDSLRAMIRIGKKAYALSYQEGLELIQAQVEFPVLQNLFVGDPLINNVPVKSAINQDSLITITVVKDDFTEVLTYNKKTSTLQELQLNSDRRDFKCNIRYEKYGPITGRQPFAFNRYVVISNKGEEVKLNMEFSKAELDVPVETNFSIPDSYQRMSIKKK